MAQRGRGGPRFPQQRLCPGCPAPEWAPEWVQVQGTMFLGGSPAGSPFISLDWGEGMLLPSLAGFEWSGPGTIAGMDFDWTLRHELATPLEGVRWTIEIVRVAGGDSSADVRQATHVHPAGVGPVIPGWAVLASTPPLGPVLTVTVKTRRWSEM